MKSWIVKLLGEVAAWYLGMAKALSIFYLAFFIPFMVVAEFMRWLNLGHIDDRHGDEALMVAIVLTIFLLVLKIASDTEEIKKRISSVS
jgi:hypothetical protein